jgi:O-antigen/teichoic acid export membrane protein
MNARQQHIPAVLRRIFGLLGLRIIALALTFVQTILITRIFGPEVFGMLSFALSIGAIIVLLMSAGFDQLLLRDLARIGVPAAQTDLNWGRKVRFVWRFLTVVQILVCAVGLAITLGTDVFAQYKIPLVIVFLTIPFQVYRRFFEAMLLGAKKAHLSMIGTQIGYPAVMIIGLGLTSLLGMDRSIETLSAIYALGLLSSVLIALFLSYTILKNVWPETRSETKGKFAVKPFVQSGFSLALVAMGYVAGQQLDSIIIGIMSDPSSVAEVRIAIRVAELIGIVRAVTVLHYRPYVVEAHAEGDMGKLQNLVREQTIIFTATGLPIMIGLWIFGDQVMAVFGPEFVGAAQVMQVYVLGVFITLICGPASLVLSFCGEEHLTSRIIWASLVVQLLLDLLLIPRFGALGCAVANMTGLTIYAFLNSYMVRRKIGVSTEIWRVLRVKK